MPRRVRDGITLSGRRAGCAFSLLALFPPSPSARGQAEKLLFAEIARAGRFQEANSPERVSTVDLI